jgi:putative transposase
MKKHRDSQKRIYFEDAVYFVTSVTKNRYPYFKERIFADIFVENLRICRRMKQFRLYGWFLGHDHFHALIQPGDEYSISDIVGGLKRNVSRDINKLFTHPESEDSHLRGEHMNARFRSVMMNGVRLFHAYHPYFSWLRSFHDHVIRDDSDFENHFDYIQFNPEKHDLPEDWPYVSENPEYKDLID